jgi:hypothetical protein
MLQLSQARSKSNQIQPNRAKPAQRVPKKTARFSLDFLVRIEPFQGLARTPWPETIFGSSLPAQRRRIAMAYRRGAGSQCGAARQRGMVRYGSGFSSPPIIVALSNFVKISSDLRDDMQKSGTDSAALVVAVGCDGAAPSLRAAKRRGNPGILGQLWRELLLRNRLRPMASGSPRRRRRCAAPRDDGAAPFRPTANTISATSTAVTAVAVGRDGAATAQRDPLL